MGEGVTPGPSTRLGEPGYPKPGYPDQADLVRGVEVGLGGGGVALLVGV